MLVAGEVRRRRRPRLATAVRRVVGARGATDSRAWSRSPRTIRWRPAPAVTTGSRSGPAVTWTSHSSCRGREQEPTSPRPRSSTTSGWRPLAPSGQRIFAQSCRSGETTDTGRTVPYGGRRNTRERSLAAVLFGGLLAVLAGVLPDLGRDLAGRRPGPERAHQGGLRVITAS